MSELAVRLLAIAAVLAIVGVAAWTASRARRARPVEQVRTDLPIGVHLFTSSTCATCAEVRKLFDNVYGNAYTDWDFETDPPRFAEHGINRVPTAVIVGPGGKATVYEGVPRKRDLVTRNRPSPGSGSRETQSP
ncbi:MAG: hypothetical protein ACRDWH_04405 [Acidimicrobiia bacterium]